MSDAPARLESLDVFRGLTIAAMILVSTPGTWTAVYPPLDHAAWHGWTPTDLVFPFLLFAMGAAVPFALARRRGQPRRVGVHVLRRTAILFLLGLVLNAIETPPPLDLDTFRIPGVLQRIAIVYAAVAFITDRARWRAQVAVAAAALVGYWAVLLFVPVPGAPCRRSPRPCAASSPACGCGSARRTARCGCSPPAWRRRWPACSGAGCCRSTRTCGPARSRCSAPASPRRRWRCATGASRRCAGARGRGRSRPTGAIHWRRIFSPSGSTASSRGGTSAAASR
ncbi:MAG: DUF5009 domain-containing protein [Acidobacteria bacterium]|nr:DUF5009 domain-containing protein [Acidobacteriota bacterium]